MYNFPIGFICGLKTAQLDLATELKLTGVQLYMPVNGKAPRDMKGAIAASVAFIKLESDQVSAYGRISVTTTCSVPSPENHAV